MIPGKLFDDIFIRFVVNSPYTTSDDIKNCVQEVITATDIVMARMKESATTNENKVKEEAPAKVENIVKPKNGMQIPSFVKSAQTENCTNFCTPRPNIVNVARS